MVAVWHVSCAIVAYWRSCGVCAQQRMLMQCQTLRPQIEPRYRISPEGLSWLTVSEVVQVYE